MSCFALPLCLLAALGADQKLVPSFRLEAGGVVEPTTVSISPDGKSLLADLKDGERYDLVAWDIPSKSRTVLAKGADAPGGSASPDGKSVLGCICVKREEYVYDVDYVVWDISTKSKTSLHKLTKTSIFALSGGFSPDGTLLAIADNSTKKIHAWKREMSTRWITLRTLDVAQRADGKKTGLIEIAWIPGTKQAFAFYPISDGTESGVLLAVEKWDIASGRRVPFPMEPMDALYTMLGQFPCVVGERTLCVQGGEGTGDGTVGIDTSSGKRKYNLRTGSVRAKVFGEPSPNDKVGAVITDGGLAGASVSLDGRTAVAVGWVRELPLAPKTRIAFRVPVSSWNLNEGTDPRMFDFPGGSEPPSGLFSADSRFFVLAAGEENRNIYVIDVKKADVRLSYTVETPVLRLSLLNSGEIAAVGIEPKAIVIWKIKTP